LSTFSGSIHSDDQAASTELLWDQIAKSSAKREKCKRRNRGEASKKSVDKEEEQKRSKGLAMGDIPRKSKIQKRKRTK